MPSPQATEERAVVEFIAPDKFHNKKAKRTFPDAVKIFSAALTRVGFVGGPFKMWPRGGTTGRPARQGKISNPMVVNPHELRFVIQTGDNGTAWEYGVTIPNSLTAQQVCEKLKSLNTEHVRDEVSEPTQSGMGEPEPAVEQLVEEKPSNVVELHPADLFNDMGLAAVAIGYVFPHVKAYVLRGDVEGILETGMPWPRERAQQCVRGLVARGCLRESGENGSMLSVGSERMSASLRKVGVAAMPPVRTMSSPETTAQPLNPSGPARVPPAKILRTPPNPTQPSVSVQGSGGYSARLEDIAKRAALFLEAQRAIRDGAQGRNALEARVVAAQRAVAEAMKKVKEAKAKLEEFDKSYHAAIAIVVDPNYSEAARKLTQIKSIMEN